MNYNKRIFKWFDWGLFAGIVSLSIYGILIIWGSTHNVPGLKNYPNKQVIWLLISFVVFIIILFVTYKKIIRYAPVFYILLATLLTLLLIFGDPIKGSNSWVKIGGLRFQPSEFMKIIVVILLADHLSKKFGRINKIKDLFIPCIIVGIPFALILKQPDLGTASIYIPILFVMLYLACSRKRLLIFLIMFGIIASISAYPLLKNYQKDRIKVYLGIGKEKKKRGSAYNIIQAEITLGSGRLFGKGFGKGTQTEFQFLPEHHTDFIFSSLGEQFGLLGCILLLLLYLYVIRRVINIIKESEDCFSVLLISGLLTIFITHIIMNIGMNVRILPVTGLPLPFMSYGGSFLLSNYIIFGLIINLKIRRFMF